MSACVCVCVCICDDAGPGVHDTVNQVLTDRSKIATADREEEWQTKLLSSFYITKWYSTFTSQLKTERR